MINGGGFFPSASGEHSAGELGVLVDSPLGMTVVSQLLLTACDEVAIVDDPDSGSYRSILSQAAGGCCPGPKFVLNNAAATFRPPDCVGFGSVEENEDEVTSISAAAGLLNAFPFFGGALLLPKSEEAFGEEVA